MSRPRKPSQQAIERRVVPLERCEIRTGAGGEPIFEGYAAVFNSLSVNLGGFRERLRPGCFAEVIGPGADVRLLINHDSNLILARSTAQTLTLTEDGHGLWCEAPLPDTSYARDLAVSMERRDITGMSFGFIVRSDLWDDIDEESGLPIRDVTLMRALYDVGPVTFPAYEATEAALRDGVRGLLVPVEVRSRALAVAEERGLEVVPVPGTDLVVPKDALDAAVEMAEAARDQDLKTPIESEDSEPEEREGKDSEPEQREGKMISAKNLQTLQDAHGSISAAADSIGSIIDAATDAGSAASSDSTEGIGAGSASARPSFIGYRKQLEGERALALAEERDWDYDDDWEIYLLTSMIGLGSSFMKLPLEAAEMSGILQDLAALLAAELSEASEPRSVEGRPGFAAAWRELKQAIAEAKAEGREWEWEDDYGVYLLTNMISLGSSFMQSEEDADDSATMAALLQRLTVLLAAEIGEALTGGEFEAALASAEPETEAETAGTQAEALRRRRLELFEREFELDAV